LAQVTQGLRDGQICILPDLSRVADDASNTEAFARRLAGYVDAYVGDAFSVCHLRHASLVRVPRLVGQRAMGFHLQRELSVLAELGRSERGPLALVVGGRRFSEKAELLNQWLPRTATVIAGGGVANTLLAAQGYALGQSEVELERLAEARSFIERARALDVQLILPTDLRARIPAGDGWQPGSLVTGAPASGDGVPEGSIVRPGQIPENVVAYDIGPESVARACDAIRQANSLLWWAPLGRPGTSGLAESTRPLAEAASRKELLSVMIGAELRRTLLCLEPHERSGFDLLSTGTEAAKVWLMGRRLSAVEVLRQP
jgi:phosphoglycerate kinase